jgi:hypothetical protein
MMALYVSDNETVELVERLAKALGFDKTATIKHATRNVLESMGLPTDIEKPKPRGGPRAELQARLHREAVAYVRLKAQVTGKKSGSRMFVMLSKHGPVETLRRLIVGGPSEGLRFLAEQNRLELAAERTALEAVYQDLIPDDIRERARENLAYAEAIRRRD